MNQKPVNLHRSFAGLLVGNIFAIFVSGLACILVWQSVFPDFYQQLRQHLDDVKKARKLEPNKKTNDDSNRKADKKDEPKKEDKSDKQNAKKPIAPLPEFGLGVWATTLAIDLFFAALSGFLCVLIAGFARNNHAFLMALFIVVWKFQQLIGFVDNQVPPTLILAEVIGLPIACVLGASVFVADDSASDSDDDIAEDSPSLDPEASRLR